MRSHTMNTAVRRPAGRSGSASGPGAGTLSSSRRCRTAPKYAAPLVGPARMPHRRASVSIPSIASSAVTEAIVPYVPGSNRPTSCTSSMVRMPGTKSALCETSPTTSTRGSCSRSTRATPVDEPAVPTQAMNQSGARPSRSLTISGPVPSTWAWVLRSL